MPPEGLGNRVSVNASEGGHEAAGSPEVISTYRGTGPWVTAVIGFGVGNGGCG